MNPSALFLTYAAAKLEQMHGWIAADAARLDDAAFWRRPGPGLNSVGNLQLHLSGNLGQWIVGGAGGEAILRDRDGEFLAEAESVPREQLTLKLTETVAAAQAVIGRLTPERLAERIVIQGYDVTVLEAVFHATEHFSYHAGQIFLLVRLYTGADLGHYSHLGRPKIA
jgi:uncharacterized damage-inducible protein DinB